MVRFYHDCRRSKVNHRSASDQRTSRTRPFATFPLRIDTASFPFLFIPPNASPFPPIAIKVLYRRINLIFVPQPRVPFKTGVDDPADEIVGVY